MKTLINNIKNSISGTHFENHVFIVGGFVRDSLMNKQSSDLDLCVEGHINSAFELSEFLQSKFNTSEVFNFDEFGVAKLTIDGVEIEIAPCRSEIYTTGSRNPKVAAATLLDDVKRRDFTVNSLLINISTMELIDLLGGVDDINNKIIRSCSNPDWMFHDDPLRIMRAVRFAARLGFEIESDTLVSLKNNIHKLKFISRERIRDEFLKILVLKNGIKLLKETGILGFLVPEFDKMDNVSSHKNVWKHTLTVLNNSKNTTNHKLAALFHDLGKVNTANTVDGKLNFHGHQFESEKLVVKFMKTFRFTNKEIDLVSLAVRLHMDIHQEITVKTTRRLINNHGKESMLFVLDLCLADTIKRKSNYDRVSFLKDLRAGIETDRFLLNKVEPLFAGKALMEMFNLEPSKKIGELIEFQIDVLLGDPDITADEMILMLKTQIQE